ncbi:MAG: ribonuclease HI [Bacteroidetes bacterium]|nr:MAG: ribonuclease HI [Bacteroidota bacterium]
MLPQEIVIYTDGAARGNPGPGGLGVVMIYGKHRKELSEGYRLTTNNRMELLAVIRALEAIKRDDLKVRIHTDSKYVADAVNRGWIFKWESKQFKNRRNPDLWKRFLDLYRKYSISFVWVKGHSSIPENERCDRLATEASFGKSLKEDSGYVDNGNGSLASFY